MCLCQYVIGQLSYIFSLERQTERKNVSLLLITNGHPLILSFWCCLGNSNVHHLRLALFLLIGKWGTSKMKLLYGL